MLTKLWNSRESYSLETYFIYYKLNYFYLVPIYTYLVCIPIYPDLLDIYLAVSIVAKPTPRCSIHTDHVHGHALSQAMQTEQTAWSEEESDIGCGCLGMVW